MLQAHYDHRSIFYLMLGEEYIVQYLSRVTGLKLFSTLHNLSYYSCFLYHCFFSLQKNSYARTGSRLFHLIVLLSGFVQICSL